MNVEGCLYQASTHNMKQISLKINQSFFYFITHTSLSGMFSCVYTQTSDRGLCSISHKATGEMDISLLPDIHISTFPAFPRCQGISVVVIVHCEIKPSVETFNVTWTNQNSLASPRPIPPSLCFFPFSVFFIYCTST